LAPGTYSAARRNSNDTFDPPNPKVFEMAVVIAIGRGTAGM
jgi:hypothetical protein